MERERHTVVGSFFAPGEWAGEIELGAGAAHHALVKRLNVGDLVGLLGGDGRGGQGVLSSITRSSLRISVDADSIRRNELLATIEMWAPIGDRERMLWLAEKSVELGITRWRPIIYERSRSVTPRGEGEAFRAKVRQRMISALEQSGAPWLPQMDEDSTLTRAMADVMAVPEEHVEDGTSTCNYLLDAGGAPLPRETAATVTRIAFGPEGGLTSAEREQFIANGWTLASVGINVLRFETAGIAALAILRSDATETA